MNSPRRDLLLVLVFGLSLGGSVARGADGPTSFRDIWKGLEQSCGELLGTERGYTFSMESSKPKEGLACITFVGSDFITLESRAKLGSRKALISLPLAQMSLSVSP